METSEKSSPRPKIDDRELILYCGCQSIRRAIASLAAPIRPTELSINASEGMIPLQDYFVWALDIDELAELRTGAPPFSIIPIVYDCLRTCPTAFGVAQEDAKYLISRLDGYTWNHSEAWRTFFGAFKMSAYWSKESSRPSGMLMEAFFSKVATTPEFEECSKLENVCRDVKTVSQIVQAQKATTPRYGLNPFSWKRIFDERCQADDTTATALRACAKDAYRSLTELGLEYRHRYVEQFGEPSITPVPVEGPEVKVALDTRFGLI